MIVYSPHSNPLDCSILFDVYRFTEYPEAKRVSEAILHMCEAPSRSDARKRWRDTANILACNLVASGHYRKPIACPFANHEFSEGGRMHHLNVSREPFKAMVNKLKDMEFIDKCNGFHNPGGTGRWTRISPTAKFMDLVDEDLLPQHITTDRPVIILRDDRDRPKKYRMTNTVKADWDLIQSINEAVAHRAIIEWTSSLSASDSSPTLGGEGPKDSSGKGKGREREEKCLPLLGQFSDSRSHNAMLDTDLHSVFNLSFKLGGRLYTGGAGYQQFNRDERKMIRLDGTPVAELDFSCLHINLLYARQDKQLCADAYHINGLGNDNTTLRPIIKLALLIMINAKDGGSAARAMNRRFGRKDEVGEVWNQYRRALGDKNHTGQLIHLVKETHKPIESYFCSGIGLELQRDDSLIMRSILDELVLKQGITALPVHDSVIVPVDRVPYTKDLMQSVYKEYTGFNCNVGVK